MTDPNDVLSDQMDLLRQDFIKSYDELGMRASGEWAKHLESSGIELAGHMIGRVVGLPYTTQLVKGRKPGKMPPTKFIEQWIKHKGIKAKDPRMKIKQLAFAIAMKIKKKGTKYYQQGGTDLIDRVMTPERIRTIIEKVGEAMVKSQKEFIVKQAKSAFA